MEWNGTAFIIRVSFNDFNTPISAALKCPRLEKGGEFSSRQNLADVVGLPNLLCQTLVVFLGQQFAQVLQLM